MTEDQIPGFVEDILGTGCPIDAIGDDLYVLGELYVPKQT